MESVDQQTIDSTRGPEQKTVVEVNKKEDKEEELRREYEEQKALHEELRIKLDTLERKRVSSPSVKNLMEALHEYNDMKDLAQIVLGTLANLQNVTLAELHDRYRLPKDE